jgi:protein subunit release factor A
LYNLPFVMEGNIDSVIEPLMAHDLEEKFAALKM